MDYRRDLYDLFWYCAFGDRLLGGHVELCNRRGSHGRGWYISVAFHAAIPGRQSAVSLDGRVFCKWTPGPNGRMADNLVEAKAAFRAAGSGSVRYDSKNATWNPCAQSNKRKIAMFFFRSLND